MIRSPKTGCGQPGRRGSREASPSELGRRPLGRGQQPHAAEAIQGDRYRVTISVRRGRRRERSATKRPSGPPPPWPRWAATLSPAAARAHAGRQRRRSHRAGTCPVSRDQSDLPFKQDINAFVTQAFEHRTFFTRLHQFVLASDAFIVAPGGNRHGPGNDDDLAATPGAPLQDTPLILVEKCGRADEWARSSMLSFDPPLANPEDMTIPRCAANADEAIALVRAHHTAWLKTYQT